MLNFKDKVALVTGAGGGLGRAYAMLLASRGAKVVVNDLGSSGAGVGADESLALRTAREITAAGGIAVANTDSVVFGHKLVKAALDNFGRIDIIINNAGILRDVPFHKMTEDDWNPLYQVHLLGAFRIMHAAWPVMREQGYGRIVNTASSVGIYGNFAQANYCAVKAALHGMTKALAVEGQAKNIHVNSIAPAADSRLTRTVMTAEQLATLSPDLVSPLVAWLCHEDCAENGSLFEVGGGFIAKDRIERSAGVNLDLAVPDSIERVAAAWPRITDFSTSTHPADLAEANAAFPIGGAAA